MKRKVRHPYQIMEPEELVVGEQYVFVRNPYCDLYIFGGIFKNNDLIIKNPPLNTSPHTVTIHLNGMQPSVNGIHEISNPTLAYWTKTPTADFTWDNLWCYLGEINHINHSIVVPRKHWEDDPHLHVMDWVNPDDVVKRRICQTHKLLEIDGDWEQKLRAKRDVAMAKALGF